MKISIFQIDAFTSTVFAGNPAAVCPLKSWLPDATMQSVAAENNLSETAFFVSEDDGQHIRWFTPRMEVDLCGHATLASAFVIFNHLDPTATRVDFQSRSGLLKVARAGDMMVLDFPSWEPQACEPPPALAEALGAAPREILANRDYLCVYGSEGEVRALAPDMDRLAALDRPGIVVTAPGERHDFVSRFFAPGLGIPEDPVTGRAHCMLTPYWAGRLGKERLNAAQVSPRGGELYCMPRGDRVAIAGRAVRYMQGMIEI
jgi:PhzF family phenazine biosynthesis protein